MPVHHVLHGLHEAGHVSEPVQMELEGLGDLSEGLDDLQDLQPCQNQQLQPTDKLLSLDWNSFIISTVISSFEGLLYRRSWDIATIQLLFEYLCLLYFSIPIFDLKLCIHLEICY